MASGGYIYILTNRPNGILYVGVTNDLVRPHRVFILPPDRIAWPEPTGSPLKRCEQPTGFCERLIRSRGLRPRPGGGKIGDGFIRIDAVTPRISGDVPQDFAPLLVDAENLRRRGEARSAYVAKERVDRRRPGTRGPAHGVANPNDAARRTTAPEPLLNHAGRLTPKSGAARGGQLRGRVSPVRCPRGTRRLASLPR